MVIRQVKGLEMCKAQDLTATCYNKFYTHLASLYNLHQYLSNHIWKNDEIDVHASKQTGAQVLVMRGFNVIYRTIPKSRGWLTINCMSMQQVGVYQVSTSLEGNG